MVGPKKVRISVTLLKSTLDVIDKLVETLEKRNPLVPYSRSSVLEGAFIAQMSAIIEENKNQKEEEEK